MESIQHDATVLVLGNPEQSSQFIHSLLANTPVNKGTIIKTFDNNKLREIIQQQTITVKQYAYNSLERRSYLVLDHCFEDNTWTQNRLIRMLFSHNRSMGFLFVVATDIVKARAIPPVMRGELDWIVIFGESNREKRLHVYERFLHSFCTFIEFCESMDACLKDNSYLLVRG